MLSGGLHRRDQLPEVCPRVLGQQDGPAAALRVGRRQPGELCAPR